MAIIDLKKEIKNREKFREAMEFIGNLIYKKNMKIICAFCKKTPNNIKEDGKSYCECGKVYLRIKTNGDIEANGSIIIKK